jgi:pyruvate kinase
MNNEKLTELVTSGMDVARLNFSHMNEKDGTKIVNMLKNIRKKINTPLAIMLDTKGPEVRIYGHSEQITVKEGDELIIESYTKKDLFEQHLDEKNRFLTNLPKIGKITKIGSKVLLMDGFIEGMIIVKTDNSITISLKNGGELRPKAHLSIPNLDYPLPFISEKDKKDIRFAVINKLEYIALSFVRTKKDIFEVKNIIMDADIQSNIKIISKIEHKKAIDNLGEIIHFSDGIMVARGDLGVELDIEDVPIVQKKIIKECYLAGKPVITATQMLESMITNRVPTRAEASDVANACYDLTSAVMLSGETAIGKYPSLVIKTMNNILLKVENTFDYENSFHIRRLSKENFDMTGIISFNAVSTAYQTKASAILVFTKSGYTARMISKLRPGLKIHAFTTEITTFNQLAMNWGITPHLLEEQNDFETLLKCSLDKCLDEKILSAGDIVVIVAGLPLGKSGTTNTIRVEMLGKTSIKGKSIHHGKSTGAVVHISSIEDIETKSIVDKIVLLHNFQNEYTGNLKFAKGIIMESNSYEDQLTLLGLAYHYPILIDAIGAIDNINDDVVIELDADKGRLVII